MMAPTAKRRHSSVEPVLHGDAAKTSRIQGRIGRDRGRSAVLREAGERRQRQALYVFKLREKRGLMIIRRREVIWTASAAVVAAMAAAKLAWGQERNSPAK